ncbi:MAG TPA: sugar phosphate isomerase/epimerase family protein [Terriglobales bacterium]|nr:sugar phosphate isomerase/epimerase family protein [Terriglobales bacterium]
MKYGVNLMVWTTRVGPQHDALLARVKKWGFDGVELFLSTEEPADIPAVQRTLDRLKLERTTCSVLPREFHLVSTKPEVRAQGVDFLSRCVERTAELGAKIMCGPLYAGLGLMTGARRTPEEWKWAVEGLRRVASRANQLGVTLCIEPLNRFETYFLNTLQDASLLVHDIGASNVRIHFDTFHSNIEERKPAAELKRVAKYLGHVHISENDRGIPGSGHVEWRKVLSTLRDVGYDGWLTIESFAEPGPELAAAASIWRDLAPSGDELAHQGLNFVKGLAKELGIR